MSKPKQTVEQQVQNLPSIRNLRREITDLEILGKVFVKSGARERANEINVELEKIVNIVIRFYELLGDRHWVFSDVLNLERIEAILTCETADSAELALIDYLKGPHVLDIQINRLKGLPDMRPRVPLLRKAAADFREGRYCSSVLVVVSVMDGFVNDIDKAERKGLHARKPEEMQDDECVAAIWAGLPSAQEVFTKPIHKRIDEPLHDVYRHALMHGMATNFDNDIIASKAWCMLFGIVDWAKAGDEESLSKESSPSFVEVMQLARRTYLQNKKNEHLIDQWQRHEVDLENPNLPDNEIINAIKGYCTA